MTSGSDFFKNFRISGSLPLLKEINVKVSPVFFLNANAKMPVANILVAVILFCNASGPSTDNSDTSFQS